MKIENSKIKKFLKKFGPGLITGSSDDDPSGIATYTQAGAAFGFGTIWSAIYTFPLMAAVQEMCARIGLVTRQGLAGVLKKYYSKKVLIVLIILSGPAIILNIASDIAAMGAVSNLLIPSVPETLFSTLFTILLMLAIIYFPYKKMSAVLKWLCLSLLLYIIVPFIIDIDWREVLFNLIVPHITWNKSYLLALVAILGTTISPYLFFWQTSMEVEENGIKKGKKVFVNKSAIHDMREDIDAGMFFSNLVMFFIILTAGAVLYKAGINNIESVEQAASALMPLAGKWAYLFFALGVIGTGFLAIPVLAGALSYIVAETFGWKEGMNKKFHEAPGFYYVIIISLTLGLTLNFLNISPIQALIYTAVLYGIVAPFLIGIIMHICNNKKIMGKYVNGPVSNILGAGGLLIMASAAILLFIL